MARPTPDHILQTGFGFWASKTLLTAIEAGLFTELAKGPQRADGLAARLGWKARNVSDAFDALVSLGFLTREDGQYRNTPETDYFLDRAKPSYVGGILEMANTRLYGFWGGLGEALRTNTPQNEAKTAEKAGEQFGAMYSDPKRLEGFVKAMTGISGGLAHALADGFDWSGRRTVLDAGCAEGAVPAALIQAHPYLMGIGFDLPQVQPHFEVFAARLGLSDRLRFQGGDLFKDALPAADVIILGHMLHWADLDGKRLMVQRAYDALPPGGMVLVYDNILDEGRKTNTFGFLMSLNMLIETPGGSEYTASEGLAWLRDAGFKDTRVQPLVGPASALVGIK